MRKPFVSPYSVALRESGALELFPAVEVRFHRGSGVWISLLLLIDSGATISALPKSDAAGLGVPLEKGTPYAISGVGGKLIRGWRHELAVSIGGEEILLPAVFMNLAAAPRILGRSGIFERFQIVFEESRRRTGFVENATRAANTIRRVLDAA